MAELSEIEAQIAALEDTLGGTELVVSAFNAELKQMQATVSATGADVAQLSRGVSRGLKSAFDDVVFEGKTLSAALDGLARSMVNAAYNAAMRPVASHVGGLIASGVGSLFGGAFADGASFSQGRVMPFAKGGVVAGATTFPMRGGFGLMGEAGPEAIMPLSRGADGRLGVKAEGGRRPVQVVVNVSTPDVEGFRRSGSQIAAQMSRALGRADRNR